VKGRLWYIPCEGSTSQIPPQVPEHKYIHHRKQTAGIRTHTALIPSGLQKYGETVCMFGGLNYMDIGTLERTGWEVRRRGCKAAA